jgi:predicted permease
VRRLEQFLQDLQYTMRMLRSNPAFTGVVALTLALGIGANTVVFSVVDAVLLQPLPYREPERLFRVMVHSPQRAGEPSAAIDSYDFAWLRDQVSSFEAAAAYRVVAVNFMGGEAEQYSGQRVTAGMFRMLGVEPIVGRDFLPEEHKTTDPEVIVISHRVWLERFGGDPTVIGRDLRLGGFLDAPGVIPVESRVTVVGVMPPDFEAPRRSGLRSERKIDFWLPYEIEYDSTDRVIPQSIARLRDDVTEEEAVGEMNVAAVALERAYPDWNPGRRFSLRPLNDDLAEGGHTRILWILLGAVGFVMLIAVANIANLLLARTVAREREITIRKMLGAGRGRLLRQLLTESVVLGVIGGTAGVMLAYFALPTVVSLLPPELPRTAEIQLDGRVLVFTLVMSIAAGILFGLAPALGTRGSAPKRSRAAFMATQIGLALVLLVGAGLLIRSFWLLTGVELGFDPRNVIATRISGIMLKTPDPMEHQRFYENVIERVQALPGVDSAALTRINVPLSGLLLSQAGIRVAPGGEDFRVGYQIISDDYFRVLRVPLLSGRTFEPRDDFGAPHAAIVNETMARRLWPGEDPLNRQLYDLHYSRFSPPHTVIGVVSDVREGGPGWEMEPVMYVSHRQDPRVTTVLVRTVSDPASLLGPLQAELRSIDADVPIPPVRTLDSALVESTASPRFRSVLLGMFAAIAMALALVGIYGVVAYTVARRSKEIGVRMALGAHATGVLLLVLRQSMTIALLGMGAGLLASLWLTRFLRGMLFGITSFDAWTYAVVCVALLAASLLASYIPARRATRVDPTSALRHE